MPTVDLVYDEDCPNVAIARAHLLAAFRRCGVVAKWNEYVTSDPAAPTRVHGYGSPTVLVNGRDVAGLPPSVNGNCCRIYTGQPGTARAPSVDQIAETLVASVA